MGWLGKIFGGGTSLEGLRKAVALERFADARLLAEQLLEQPLSGADLAEANRLQAAAGDGLARLNLNEGLGFQRSGDTESAAEHLQLALQQVCSADLRREIEQAAETPLQPIVEAPVKDCRSESCAGCGPQEPAPPADTELDPPDRESQLELVLTSYPPPLAERYRGKSERFLQAFLLSHAGQEEVALSIWQQLPVDDQDELYWFELGAVQSRCGHSKEGRESLEKAVQIDPGFLLASEALVSLLISLNDAESALNHLQQLLKDGQDPAFCHANLTLVRLQQQQPGSAIDHVRQAVAAGVLDADFLQLAAQLLEQAGELDEAEDILQRLPGSGCSGGISLPLAEFLLRQKRDLTRILDAFNGACQQNPQDPRWQLRVAQTYLARNWRKEGLELLKKVIDDPRLDPVLRQEAQPLLAEQETG